MRLKISPLVKKCLLIWGLFIGYQYLFIGVFVILRLKKGIFIDGYGNNSFNGVYYSVAKNPFLNLKSPVPIKDFLLNLLYLGLDCIIILIPVVLAYSLLEVIVIKHWGEMNVKKRLLYLSFWAFNIGVGFCLYALIWLDYVLGTGVDSL